MNHPARLLLSMLMLVAASTAALAALPGSFTHNTRFIEADGRYTYWYAGSEAYVKNTLPNEWGLSSSWADASLQAGSVIIRSGVYWRINRSVLNSSWPNNNCYKGTSGTFTYYRTAPVTRGGQEQFIPNSTQPRSDTATDATYRYHAETTSLVSGRPDRFIGLRYNSTIQNRTNTATGTWLQRIRYAYVGTGAPGAPFDPNKECSQVDDQTTTNPTFINN